MRGFSGDATPMVPGINERKAKLLSIVVGIKELLGVGMYLLLLGLLLEGLAVVLRQWISFPLALALATQILFTVLCVSACLLGAIWFNCTLDLIRVHLLNGKNELVTSGPFAYVRHPLYATLVMTIPPLLVVWLSDLLFVVPWVLILVLAHFGSRIAHLFFRFMARLMDSPLRYRLSDPVTILEGAGLGPGQEVLEIGCGTGFFTIAAAEMVGDGGCLYAVDPHPLAVAQVTRKIQDAGLTNVRLLRADATEAGLASGCIDIALLLGVIPSPIIPLDRLLAEIHRLLRPEGVLAVWTAFPWSSPTSLTRSGLCVRSGSEKGVHNFRRATAG